MKTQYFWNNGAFYREISQKMFFVFYKKNGIIYNFIPQGVKLANEYVSVESIEEGDSLFGMEVIGKDSDIEQYS